MFKFSDDVAYKQSQNIIEKYPDLARYIKALIDSHSYRFSIPMPLIKEIQPEITEQFQALEVISTLLKPFGWKVRENTESILITDS